MVAQKKIMIGLFLSFIMIVTLVLTSGMSLTQRAHATGVDTWKSLSYAPYSHITQAQAGTSPLPTWSSSFAYNGTTYPYTMIGTNPANGSATTTIPVTIVPLKLVFSDGSIFDGTKLVKKMVQSPIFQPTQFTSGNTQFGDAMQRAEFWQIVSKTSPNYHVLLGTPTIAPVATINVPAADGYTATNQNGKFAGGVLLSWFDSQLEGLVSSYNLTPAMLPVFLSGTVATYNNPDHSGCCFYGYHHVTNATLQTYIWTTYYPSGVITNVQDSANMSHEIAEWLSDPFLNNVVPSWNVPSEPFYGCTSLLEVGDPLAGVIYKLKIGTTVYHLQDIAFFSWFARQSPSIGIKGRYTYLGKFSTYSPSC